MRPLRQDVQFGLRIWKNTPALTVVAVLTLALGIAVNTTVFSWIDSVLLHPYPGVGNPQELALVETMTPGGEALVNTSYLDYRDYRSNLRLVSGLAIARFTPLSVGADGKTGRAWAELVSANYFDVLQVKPVLGRTFLPEEGGDQAGAYPVTVISHKLWSSRFHADPKVLGKTIRLNRHEVTIVGVAPPEFRGSTVGVVYDLWMPITMATAMGTGKGTLGFRGTRDLTTTVARLKPGVTVAQARAEMAGLAKRLAAIYPDTNRAVEATMVPVWAGHLGAQGFLLKPLRILMAVCLLMLLIVCANVTNLLLARAVSRRKEFSIRLAMGAGRRHLLRQLFVETLLLAGAGAAAGAILVLWMRDSLLWLLPSGDVPIEIGGALDVTTLGFTLAIAVAATLACGIAPALVSVRADLHATLKEGGRSGASGTHTHRLRGLLVIAEIALAMVALVGAGLFFRSFRNAGGIEPGFNMTNVSVSHFYLSSAGYSGPEQRQFCRALRQRMEAVPGVIGMSYSDVVPLEGVVGSSPWHQIEVDGYVPAPKEQMVIHRATVPPGHFKLLGIPLLEGRDFTEKDEAGKPLVMIVNATFARHFFGCSNPIGRKVKIEGEPLTVVGMVKDSKINTPIESPFPYFYVPFQQRFAPGLNFAVLLKTSGDPMRMIPTLRREALALNQDANFRAGLLVDAVGGSLYPQKVAANLLSVVGVVSLLLAALGLYSVMSYAVSQRTRELGIRMALGAQSGHVRGLVVREGIKLTAPGLLVGLAGGLAAARVVSGMLVDVSAADPLTFGVAAVFLGSVAMLASYMPAVRATRVDPVTALRCE